MVVANAGEAHSTEYITQWLPHGCTATDLRCHRLLSGIRIVLLDIKGDIRNVS